MRTLVIDNKVKDWPYKDLLPKMARFRNEGKSVVPKFTCSHCGKRAYGQVNNLSAIQVCSECGEHHDYAKSGGNYALGTIIGDSDLKSSEATEEWLKQRRAK